jgi:hypothetical protein
MFPGGGSRRSGSNFCRRSRSGGSPASVSRAFKPREATCATLRSSRRRISPGAYVRGLRRRCTCRLTPESGAALAKITTGPALVPGTLGNEQDQQAEGPLSGRSNSGRRIPPRGISGRRRCDVWPKQTNTDKEAQERSSKSRIGSVGSLSLLL